MNKLNKYKKYLKDIKRGIKNANFSTNARLSTKKQTFFAKRLSFLIKSGVPVIEGVILIREQTKSRSEIKVFDKIVADVKNGKTLAGSLERCKGVFGNFSINIIKAGETSGTLTENLNYLADELKKKEMLRHKIMGALLYPVIVTVATFGITGFLVMYIFPKIIPIFSSLKAKLPLSTRIIIAVTEIIKNYGIYILIGIIIFVAASIIIHKKIRRVRFVIDGLLLRAPIFGAIVKNYNLTNTTRTLGLLLKSGLSVTEALHVTSDTIENLQYKDAFHNISREMMKGKNISELITAYPPLFPDMLKHMVAVGEKTGNLSNTLIYLSEFYENEFEDQTKNLSSTIEPVLMIIMGVMVGFIAISVITPIYEITNSIKR